jgi:hypothetical protein
VLHAQVILSVSPVLSRLKLESHDTVFFKTALPIIAWACENFFSGARKKLKTKKQTEKLSSSESEVKPKQTGKTKTFR